MEFAFDGFNYWQMEGFKYIIWGNVEMEENGREKTKQNALGCLGYVARRYCHGNIAWQYRIDQENENGTYGTTRAIVTWRYCHVTIAVSLSPKPKKRGKSDLLAWNSRYNACDGDMAILPWHNRLAISPVWSEGYKNAIFSFVPHLLQDI